MIGLDTNVLVRYLTQDDPKQSRQATQLIESLGSENQGFISLVVITELYWVLRRTYKLSPSDTAAIVGKLLSAEELLVQEPTAVYRALTRISEGADFADALIGDLGTMAGCSYTATFDSDAARLPGMRHVSDATY